MRVTTQATFSFLAVLIILTLSDIATGQGNPAAFAESQLWLSPVNTGDCVAARIIAKRTIFIDEFDKKYCARNDPDKAKTKKCLENSKLHQETSFFTDRCSEETYFIGLNGEEVRLTRISKKPRKPHLFIGSFAGEGVSVEIGHPRLIGKSYVPNEPRTEANVLDAAYRVLVTVKKGALKKTFKGVLSYGK
jgi:hypothetical protein